MWEHGFWVASFISIAISFSISGWAGLRFTSFWLKLVFFLFSVVLGFFFVLL